MNKKRLYLIFGCLGIVLLLLKTYSKDSITNSKKFFSKKTTPADEVAKNFLSKNSLGKASEQKTLAEKNLNNKKSPQVISVLSLMASAPKTESYSENDFQKTYQDLAELELSDDSENEFVVDFTKVKQDFLSMGFVTESGKINEIKVKVEYVSGETRILKPPYESFSKDDIFKIDHDERPIKHIFISAKSLSQKSKLKFYLQKELTN